MSDTISSRWCGREVIVMKRCYCLVMDEAAYYEEMNRYGVPIEDQGAWISPGSNATVTYANSGVGEPLAIVAIRVNDTRTPIQVAGLLVHEAVHLVQRLCTDIGEHQPGAEFQAYATQWISQELMEQYVEQTEGARFAPQPLENDMAKMTPAMDAKKDKKAGVKPGSKKDAAPAGKAKAPLSSKAKPPPFGKM